MNFLKQKYNWVFLIFLALPIIDRILLLYNFGFIITDNDQMVFWQGANDFAQGKFYEPYFYGQNYNFMLEAFLAAPLIISGVSIAIALPIITNILALLPYYVIALALHRNNYLPGALLFLSILLMMPVEYGMITSLSRGFISGLAVCGFLIYPLLSPYKSGSYIIYGAVTALGYILNPNSLVLTFPIGVYLFTVNWSRPSFYWITAVSALPFLAIQYLARQFYAVHEEYNVHAMWKLHFSFSDLLESFNKLDKMMGYLTPAFWFWGWFGLILLMICAILLWKPKRVMSISITLGILFIVVVLGFNKVHDFRDTIFFPGSRMFLGMPLLIGLGFYWVLKNRQVKIKQVLPLFTGLVLATFLAKASIYPEMVRKQMNKPESLPLARHIDKVKLQCEDFQRLIKLHNIDIIIFVPDWRRGVPHMEFFNYGCPLLTENFSKTVLNIYERRTWIFLKEKDEINETVLIYGGVHFDLVNALPNSEVLGIDPDIVLIKENDLTTLELMEKLNLDYQRFRY